MTDHKEIIENEIINNIFPEYQAIIDINKSTLNNYDIIKYEALLRSKYKNKILYPADLLNEINIDNIEVKIDKTKLTKQMFYKVLEDIKNHNINVSFNISLSDIENIEILNMFYEEIKKTLNNKKIAEYLTFEFIEEEEIIKNKSLVQEFIKKVHEYGGKVALDDFGKGYATFEPMLEFDFDIIKFDKVLVDNFLKNPVKYYLLNTLIEMFNKLGKKVVAEYIERKQEFNAVKYIGCHYGQGFCIAKPQSIENYINKTFTNICKEENNENH